MFLGELVGLATGAIGVLTTAFGAVAGAVTAVFGSTFGIVAAGLIVSKVAMNAIGKLMTREKEEVEEIGDRIIQGEAQGIKMEDYESFEEFRAALNGVKLDPEKSKNIKPEEKNAAGMAFQLKELELKYDFGIKGISELVSKNPEFENSEILGNVIHELKENGYSAKDVERYYAGELSDEEMEEIESIIVSSKQ